MPEEDELLLSVSDRLKWALARRKLPVTGADLARATLVKEVTARSYLNGTRQPSLPACLKMGEKLQVNGFWLFNGEGDRMSATPPASLDDDGTRPFVPLQERSKGKLIPVFSASLAGPDGEIELVIERSHQVLSPASLEDVPEAYGTTVGGDSMLERFQNGETVFVNPYKPIVRGDDVVVQISPMQDGSVYGLVKRFVSFDADELVLEQLNPKKQLRYPRSQVRAVHKIVDHAMR